MSQYKAILSILYAGRYYASGDEVPYDERMTPLWLKNGAVMVDTGEVHQVQKTEEQAGNPVDTRAKKLAQNHSRQELVAMAKNLGVDSKEMKVATSKEKLAALITEQWPETAPESATESAVPEQNQTYTEGKGAE